LVAREIERGNSFISSSFSRKRKREKNPNCIGVFDYNDIRNHRVESVESGTHFSICV